MSALPPKATLGSAAIRILFAQGQEQRRLMHVVLRIVAPQWRVNAVQVGGVDLHFAVFAPSNRNLSSFDRTQNRSFIPADRRSGCCKGVHRVLPTVAVIGYDAAATVKKRCPPGFCALVSVAVDLSQSVTVPHGADKVPIFDGVAHVEKALIPSTFGFHYVHQTDAGDCTAGRAAAAARLCATARLFCAWPLGHVAIRLWLALLVDVPANDFVFSSYLRSGCLLCSPVRLLPRNASLGPAIAFNEQAMGRSGVLGITNLERTFRTWRN